MKKIILSAIIIAVISISSIASAEYVKGHYRSNGTYVEGYHRTSPNSTKFDNYSTRGNVNPYTGQKGYKSPY